MWNPTLSTLPHYLRYCGRSPCFHSAFLPSLAFFCWVSSIYLRAAPLTDPHIALACIAVEGSQSPLGPSRTPSSVSPSRAPLAAIAFFLSHRLGLPPESHTVTANPLTGSPILKILGWSGRRPPKTTEASPNSKHNPACSLSTFYPLLPLLPHAKLNPSSLSKPKPTLLTFE